MIFARGFTSQVNQVDLRGKILQLLQPVFLFLDGNQFFSKTSSPRVFVQLHSCFFLSDSSSLNKVSHSCVRLTHKKVEAPTLSACSLYEPTLDWSPSRPWPFVTRWEPITAH